MHILINSLTYGYNYNINTIKILLELYTENVKTLREFYNYNTTFSFFNRKMIIMERKERLHIVM